MASLAGHFSKPLNYSACFRDVPFLNFSNVLDLFHRNNETVHPSLTLWTSVELCEDEYDPVSPSTEIFYFSGTDRDLS